MFPGFLMNLFVLGFLITGYSGNSEISGLFPGFPEFSGISNYSLLSEIIIKDFRVSKRELCFLDWLAKSGLFPGFPDFFRYFRRFSRISGLFPRFPDFSGISGSFPASGIVSRKLRKNSENLGKSPEIPEKVRKSRKKVRKSGKTSGNTGKSPEIRKKVQIWLTSPKSGVLSWKPGNL